MMSVKRVLTPEFRSSTKRVQTIKKHHTIGRKRRDKGKRNKKDTEPSRVEPSQMKTFTPEYHSSTIGTPCSMVDIPWSQFVQWLGSQPGNKKKDKKMNVGVQGGIGKKTTFCQTPMDTSTFQFVHLDHLSMLPMEYQKHPYQEGTYNQIFHVNKYTCDGTKSLMHPNIILRMSKHMYEKEDPMISRYQDEMRLQTSLHGIMPDVYICGTCSIHPRENLLTNREEDKNISTIPRSSTKHMIRIFSVMEKFDVNVQQVLKHASFHTLWNIMIQESLQLLKKIAYRGICNVDVKPSNTVISFSSSLGGIPMDKQQQQNEASDRMFTLALIDIDPAYHMTLSTETYCSHSPSCLYEIYYLIMAYQYLHIISNQMTTSLKMNMIIDTWLTHEIQHHPSFSIFSQVVHDILFCNGIPSCQHPLPYPCDSPSKHDHIMRLSYLHYHIPPLHPSLSPHYEENEKRLEIS
jgi:hypothetical protein